MSCSSKPTNNSTTRVVDIQMIAMRATSRRSPRPLALTDLGARVRAQGVPEGLPFSHDGASLGAASIWNLVCDAAVFDIAFRPSGFAGGYDDLSQRARAVVVDGVPTQIADLADVVASKRAAGRPKDIAVLPVLEAFLEIRRGEPEVS